MYKSWLLFLFVVIPFICFYLFVSYNNYTSTPVVPGLVYTLDGTTHTVPNLEYKGSTFLLKETFQIDQKQLLGDTMQLFTRLGIPLWISGGTLLGFCRHGTIMPWDDDLDCHTFFIWSKYLFSSTFQNECRRVGLESIRLRWFKFKWSTRVSAGIRIRRRGTIMPCVDIFFVCYLGDHITKINSWSPSGLVHSDNELWPVHDILPLRSNLLNGVNVQTPNNPEHVVRRQYGSNVMTCMYFTSVGLSHALPFYMTPIWTTV